MKLKNCDLGDKNNYMKNISYIKVQNTLINNESPQKSHAILNPLSHVAVTCGNVATSLRQTFVFYAK